MDVCGFDIHEHHPRCDDDGAEMMLVSSFWTLIRGVVVVVVSSKAIMNQHRDRRRDIVKSLSATCGEFFMAVFFFDELALFSPFDDRGG